mgnify:CR=1 FL=1
MHRANRDHGQSRRRMTRDRLPRRRLIRCRANDADYFLPPTNSNPRISMSSFSVRLGCSDFERRRGETANSVIRRASFARDDGRFDQLKHATHRDQESAVPCSRIGH